MASKAVASQPNRMTMRHSHFQAVSSPALETMTISAKWKAGDGIGLSSSGRFATDLRMVALTGFRT
jgi:hypothetical protein